MPEGNVKVAETQITTAGHAIDLSALPAKSISALLSRGLTHYLGSEQASKVKARKDKFAAENDGAELAEDEVTAIKQALVADAVKALQEGTIGSRAVGIVIDPLEKVKHQVARAMVIETLKANGIKVPKGDEACEFAGGVKLTMADMIERKMAKEEEAITKKARSIIAEKEKSAKAARALAASVDAKTADALF